MFKYFNQLIQLMSKHPVIDYIITQARKLYLFETYRVYDDKVKRYRNIKTGRFIQ